MKYILVYLGSIILTLFEPAHLVPGMSFKESALAYYESTPNNVYGYATRYGSNDVALRELFWLSHEYCSQSDRGWGMVGGGYGYWNIGGDDYLLENRASLGFTLAAGRLSHVPNENQRNLYQLSTLTWEQFQWHIEHNYVGIVATKSPNDIGAEYCMYDLAADKTIGLVIVGGAAARNDWTYYGPSVNDNYGHERLGIRVLHTKDRDYYWIADLSDRVYDRISGGSAKLIGLLNPAFCTLEIEHAH